MTTFYHILGADIPHHNQTLLAFFQNQLLPSLNARQHIFYVVSSKPLDFPHLNLEIFADRKMIAQRIITTAKQDNSAKFILYGQFNPYIWLALLFNQIPKKQVAWHIWGADLYETAKGVKAKLFYILRRKVQKDLPEIWATQGDLHYVKQHLRPLTPKDRLLYFPTKLAQILNGISAENSLKTILLGNSGDPSNQHILALDQIYQAFGDRVKIIIPMGYPENNDDYINLVEKYGKQLFSAKNLQILREKLSFADYSNLLNQIDLGFFDFERQQGIGTICLLISQNIPFVLNPKNPFCEDLRLSNVPFLTTQNLSEIAYQKTYQQLAMLNKSQIRFFPENYLKDWQNLFHS